MTKTKPTVYNSVFGWFNFEGFYDKVAEELPNNFKFAEIGVFMGRSVIYLAEKVKLLGKSGTIFAVDHFQGSDEDAHREILKDKNLADAYFENVQRCGVADRIISMPFNSVEALKFFQNGELDGIFVDASHWYKDVRSDIVLWSDKVKTGGILAGHDYHGDWAKEVQPAVADALPSKTIESSQEWGTWWTTK